MIDFYLKKFYIYFKKSDFVFMFEIQKKVGDDGDFQTLDEALKSEETGVTLLISSEKEHVFTDKLVINKSFALQSFDDNLATIKAPQIVFEMLPNVFCSCTKLKFIGQVEVIGGSTTSFELCHFYCNDEASSIVNVRDSSPTFRMCYFHDFNGAGVSYYGTRGGMIFDCVFENVSGEMIQCNDKARPMSEHNSKK